MKKDYSVLLEYKKNTQPMIICLDCTLLKAKSLAKNWSKNLKKGEKVFIFDKINQKRLRSPK